MSGRRRLGVVVAAGLVVASVGCASSDGTDAAPSPSPTEASVRTTTTTPPAATAGLPPAGALDLVPYYGDALAAIGLRLTDRGGLIDRTAGGYRPSAQGAHLALYVEPIGDRTMPQYLDGIRGATAIFAGDIFERWPGLASFDLCQEPTAADDPDPQPLPVTQIEMTRAQAATFDFTTASVVDLVRASLADPPGLDLRVSTAVANDPAYAAIVAEASS